MLSDDHFSVNGTLIRGVGQHEELSPQGRQRRAASCRTQWRTRFHGENRRNQTHASTTDPDARLYRKGPGQPAKLAYLGHVLMENRHALVVGTRLTLATGTAEREAAMVVDRPGNHRITLAAR